MINLVSEERSANNKKVQTSKNIGPLRETALDKRKINSKISQESNVIKIPYIKIDHSNKISNIDEEALINLKISLYTTLASIEEEIIGREMNKLFDMWIPNDPDTFKINVNLSKQYYEKYYLQPNTEFKILEDLKLSMDNIINRNYNMEFFFFPSYVDELNKVLVYSFLELSNSNYFLTSFNRNYKVTNHKQFTKIVEKLFDRNIDVIKRYRDSDQNNSDPRRMSVCSSSTQSSNTSGSTIFSYKYSSNINEFQIPIEMIILLNKFQTIKKLKLFVPSKIEDMLPYILILLNIDWLFPNLFEVELDLSNGSLNRDLFEQFVIKNSVMLFCPNREKKVISRKSIINSSRSKGNDYNEIIRLFRTNFELIVVFSFFISKMEKLKILNIICPDSFHNEIIEALRHSDVYLVNFTFLNFFTPISILYQLNLEFNSLDTVCFEKILSLFHKNNDLKSFKINLFGGEEHYTPNALLKLCSALNLNLTQFFSQKSFSDSLYNSRDFDADIEDFLVLKLLDYFEENLEKFFFIFQNKLNLREFHLKAELPRIISSNENYISVFHKFIFNILALLNNENCCLQTLKIVIPFLSFDNRKFPGISKFFSMLNLKDKQKNLYNLSIHLHFNKLNNLSNILSQHLKFLNIGDLDLETFSHFIKFFASESLEKTSFQKSSQLTGLHLHLSNTIFDSKVILPELFEFLKNNTPYALREFSLISNTIPSKEDFIKLYSTINYDRIERYKFEFNRKSMDLFINLKNDLPDLYYRLENRKLNIKILQVVNSLKIFNNSFFTGELGQKIFFKIQGYLEAYEKKQINITFK